MAWQIIAAVVGVAASLWGASAGMSAASSAGRQARLTAYAQAAEFRRAAVVERQLARFQAQSIRRKAIDHRSTQIAAAAHNGIMIGSGTNASMVAKTMRLAKQDMIVTMYNAEQVARNLEIKARDAERIGVAQTGVYAAQGSQALAQGVSGVATALATFSANTPAST